MIFLVPNYIKPRLSILKENQTLRIICKTFKSALWKHNNRELNNISNVIIKNKKLVIKKVLLKNKGTYTCEGRTKNGSFFYSESRIKIKSEFRLIIIILLLQKKE